METDKIKLETISWSSPEYYHKERSNDWFWTVGIIAIIGSVAAVWFNNYIFAIFIIISGASLIMFTIRPPHDTNFIIETDGLTMGRDLYEWKKIKSFNIKETEKDLYAKLLIETNKNFLPIYTIILPKEYTSKVKENLLKVIPISEINESQSMLFAEKIGL
jgi:hypothetical protein